MIYHIKYNKTKSHTLLECGFFYFRFMRNIAVILIYILYLPVQGQNTIGLLSFSKATSYDGYNLLYPQNQSTTYLIDNCGQIVHTWGDIEPTVPGNSVYITEEGQLIRCKRLLTSAVNDPIWAGGGGETVEILEWDGESMASFTLNDSTMRLHHDIAPMPNGNILMIAWELKSMDQSIEAGRNPALLDQDKLWPEVILEWDPSKDSIVWEWKSWDHLIQDFDPSKNNFGVVSEHPELINLNYDEHDGHPDWLHINAIDYNPSLDQIVVSVPYFNEFWIIDHSTTTEEASGHQGGASGKGGDLLYRWGNPKAYNREGDQKLFFQHDVHWVSSTTPTDGSNLGRIVLFNNRVSETLSTANVLSTPVSADGSYTLEGNVYGPSDFERVVSYPGDEPRSVSSSLSSAQLLPNGNMLVCAGRWGFSYEVTEEDKLAWEYITPIKAGNPLEQGDTTLSINNNLTFRTLRYSTDFEGFDNRDLSPKGFIENLPNEGFCDFLITNTVESAVTDFVIYPNPASSSVTIERMISDDTMLELYDISGMLIRRQAVSGYLVDLDLRWATEGVYFVRVDNLTSRFVKI